MSRIFYLDLRTLIENLLKDATLTTSLFRDLDGFKEPCIAQVQVRNQVIITSLIEGTKSRRRLEGEEALQILYGVNEWEVHFEPLNRYTIDPQRAGLNSPGPPEAELPQIPFPPSTPPLSFTASAPTIPRPLVSGLSLELLSLSTRERLLLRTVFRLVNGERSVEQMKAQLNLAPEVIDQAIEKLRLIGAIS
ncbi:MAG TPA: hypothetical protein VKR06_17030 [Ktedonosporobacter sp.]|nr:hypothetical protein [Ktedonosporobacter sp.]